MNPSFSQNQKASLNVGVEIVQFTPSLISAIRVGANKQRRDALDALFEILNGNRSVHPTSFVDDKSTRRQRLDAGRLGKAGGVAGPPLCGNSHRDIPRMSIPDHNYVVL
jgi:hypothetical protein